MIIHPRSIGNSPVTIVVTDPGDDSVFDTLDDRSTERTFQLAVTEHDTPWQNPSTRHDVNNDGEIGPIDALIIINALNDGRRGDLVGDKPANEFYLDVNGDNRLESLDALEVINR